MIIKKFDIKLVDPTVLKWKKEKKKSKKQTLGELFFRKTSRVK